MAINDIYLINNDLAIKDGDFYIGESDQQHIEDIIQSFQGEWKEFPNVGVGVVNYLNSTGEEQRLARLIKTQLQADGFSADNSTIKKLNDGTLEITPNAIRN